MASDDDCYDYEYDYDEVEEEDDDDDEMMMMEADEDGLVEEDTPAPERPADCWAITQESLSTAQQQDLSMVMNLLNVKQHNARALLIHHRWKIDCIYDHLDRKGRDHMFREAGIVLQENINGKAPPSRLVNCMVCFDEFSVGAVSTMECGHYFCNDCWTEHFKASVESGKKQIRCMGVKCPVVCDEPVVQQLLARKYPDTARRFDRFLLESYLEGNDSVKWCPSVPHCGRAIRVGAGERYCEVECPCGLGFCFACAAGAHSPCPCTMWDMWEVKCNGESETVNWILANTKSCPKCFKPIVKDGGCNLVTCKCGQYLCWKCGAATGYEHTWDSIDGHSCNRFTGEEKKKVDTAKRNLDRYTHYYDRFKIHGDSYKLEHDKLGPAIEERAKQLEALHDQPLVRDCTWLMEAHRGLLRSRQVLLRSYVFAYYMFGSDDDDDKVRMRPADRDNLAVAQGLFENFQEELERHVERLSELLATEYGHKPEEESVLHDKQNAMNLAKIIQTNCGEIYTCIQDELLPLLLDPITIAAYRPRGPDKAKEFTA
ncbi:probable E3 ubiquitin-protein ligase ARI1 [Hordeum vulgare subsp. vulgare]|uniref:RBR-type E3 ubiquitin transferase n=1 Tax=Hordeum vulgare subsp. vulgare TaxID=112509 RepID=A0A8I6WYM4_HORVV|nr:probable E3 ubiquitin-protein ligase ARI1 [Hordeum vulgare subsp. vulgare]